MEDSQRFEKLGMSLLEQHMDEGNENSTVKKSKNDPIYIHTIELSQLLQSLSITAESQPTIDSSQCSNIIKKIQVILDDLHDVGSDPSPEVGPGTSIFEAYKVISFSALFVYNTLKKQKTDQFKSKYEQLKKEYNELQSKYNELLISPYPPSSNSSQLTDNSDDSLLQTLITEFGLPLSTTKKDIVSLLRKKIVSQNLTNNGNDVNDSNLLNDQNEKMQDLKQKCKQLEDLNLRKDKEIENLKLENEKLYSEIESNLKLTDQFNNQLETLRSQLNSKTSSDDNTSARAFIAETELSATQIRCKDLESELRKHKSHQRELSQQLSSVQEALRASKLSFEAEKIRADKATFERDELLSKLNEKEIQDKNTQQNDLEILSTENEKLHNVISELATQMQAITEDLTTESENKSKLMSIVQKQSSVLIENESRLKVLQKANDQLTTENSSLKNKIISSNENSKSNLKNEDEIISVITSYINSLPSDFNTDGLKKRINSILNEDIQPLSTRIKLIAQELFEYNNENSYDKNNENSYNNNENISEMNQLCQRLGGYLSNLVHFMGQLADSGDIQQWLIDVIPADFRNQIQAQCARVESFIRSNGLEIESSNISFVDFGKRVQSVLDQISPSIIPISSKSSKSNNFYDISDPSENSDKIQSSLKINETEFYLLLQQCALANDILRKYSDELLGQSQHLLSDMKSLRYELKTAQDLNDEIQEDSNVKVSDLETKIHLLDQLLSTVQSQLRLSYPSDTLHLLNTISASRHKIMDEPNSNISDQNSSLPFSEESYESQNLQNSQNSIQNSAQNSMQNSSGNSSQNTPQKELEKRLRNSIKLLQRLSDKNSERNSQRSLSKKSDKNSERNSERNSSKKSDKNSELYSESFDFQGEEEEQQQQEEESEIEPIEIKDEREYIEFLELRLEDTLNDLERANTNLKLQNQEAKELMLKLRQEKKEAKKETAKIAAENKQHVLAFEKELAKSKEEIRNLLQEKDKLEEANNQMNSILLDQTKQLKSINLTKEKEYDEMQQKFEEQLEEIQRENSQKIEEIENNHFIELNNQQKLFKQNKNQMKMALKKSQKEIEEQNQRIEEIKGHYENLLENLRKSNKDAKINENNAKEKSLQDANLIKSLKSELSNLRIESKMNSMKANANEEKAKREKSLLENQYKLQMNSLKTQTNAQIDEIKAETDKKIHSILVGIAEKFKEYVNFGESISENSINEVLDKVQNDMETLRSDAISQHHYKENILSLQKALSVSSDEDVLPAVLNLQKSLRQSQNSISPQNSMLYQNSMSPQNSSHDSQKVPENFNGQNQIEKEQWLQWGRRMHALVTDNLAIRKGDKEIQYVLEEALMSAIGQRVGWRRLEMLRTEKKFLISGIKETSDNPNNSNPSLQTLLIIVNSIRRMQKQAGHLHCPISLSSPKKDDENIYSSSNSSVSSPSKKRFPILTSL